MPPHIIPGLNVESASQICINDCKAMCCRGSLVLILRRGEVQQFKKHATTLGVYLMITETPDGGGWVRFSDHPGDHCPMLDGENSICRIYGDRPQRCRDFPDNLTPGCVISGG